MNKNHYLKRLNKKIQKEISIILNYKIQDPRINFITVSNVLLSRDLHYIKIFISFLKDKDIKNIKNNLDILKKMSGFIKKNMSKNLHLRIIPKLIFIYDHSISQNIYMSNLINKISK